MCVPSNAETTGPRTIATGPIRIKTNVAKVLRAELARRSWRRELVAIGAATVPYQPAEGWYRLTRRCIEALADARATEHHPFTPGDSYGREWRSDAGGTI